ncbi:MAG: glycosyltransferase family 2 protein [Bacteroidota bacterium]
MKKYLYRLLAKYLSFHISESSSVIEIGNSDNHLLKQNIKTCNYKIIDNIEEITSPSPDFIVLNGNVHYEKDVQEFFSRIHEKINFDSRLIIIYYSSLWKPFIKLATFFKLRTKKPEENWITHEDVQNLLSLNDLQIVRRDSKVIFPLYIPLLSYFINRNIAPLPFFRFFSLINIVVARSVKNAETGLKSVSIVVPARNEEGNIEVIAQKLPKFSENDELIFIEGNSTDNTWRKIQEIAEKYKSERKIIFAQQVGKGKGDAVRKGFSLATGDILMIFDADITVPHYDIDKFFHAIKNNKGEFINGSRLVYPMEKEAMRFLNMVGNKFFAQSFSFTIGQRFNDTLCGTKVISRKNYLKLIENRKYFGEFDPFGDFDLIFGATKLALKIVEIPVRYRERTYGSTNISRWKHGVILLRMLFFAMRKIKFI